MKISKEWCEESAKNEDGLDIGAGMVNQIFTNSDYDGKKFDISDETDIPVRIEGFKPFIIKMSAGDSYSEIINNDKLEITRKDGTVELIELIKI